MTLFLHVLHNTSNNYVTQATITSSRQPYFRATKRAYWTNINRSVKTKFSSIVLGVRKYLRI